jgi:hypothetical protein
MAGKLYRKDNGGFAVLCVTPCERKAPAAPQPAPTVGDLSGILALFAKAQGHLKFPAIVLSVPEAQETIRVSVAGESARVPGSLTVVSMTQRDYQDRKLWYGRVLLTGAFEASRTIGEKADPITARLRDFACDPVKIATEHGRLTGRCCFCHQTLRDERSTAVGYGETCASHWGLAWGARPAAFAAAAA